MTAYELPRQAELAAVPFFPQGDDLCGPASVSMMLNYRGQTLSPQILEPLIYVPGKKGALQAEVLAVTRRFGFIPYVIEPRLSKLVTEVSAGNPVLVLLNLGYSWLPKWHYAVVVGYDLDRDALVLRSGIQQRVEMPARRFMRHWHGSDYWAMVAMPPEQLPATAVELAYLESISTLERLQKWSAAAGAYKSALQRWPDSFFANLGAGTAHYQLGQLVPAEQYYSKAVELNPEAAVAHNNLAQTLLELGHRSRAREHAVRAVEIGGPSIDIFRETLKQIDAVRPN